MVNYKGGKVTWDNSHNWEKDDNWYSCKQDILQISYGKNCVIDVGNYGDGTFAIFVIDFSPYPNDDDKPTAWSIPYTKIVCKDKHDMLLQLQRAIDIYPGLIG